MKPRIIGSSIVFRRVMEMIAQAAPSDKNILLLGETGTGKDLVAKHIHELSGRRLKPFIALNCSAIPETLFEAELFGYRKGAFTGAGQDKLGLLDLARDGTAFLDEVGELPLSLQAKLLRIIDKRELRPLGGTYSKVIKTRFIFATNRDLGNDVEVGKFRMDLYFRISVVRFRIPSLRERKEDIPELAAYILNREKGKKGVPRHLSKGALNVLAEYSFPGNIRELENILERAALFSEDVVIRARDLRFEMLTASPSYRKDDQNCVKNIMNALGACQGNKSRAAKCLGTSRRHLYRLIDKHKLNEISIPRT